MDGRQTYRPETLVPDTEYRAEPLPGEVRDWVTRKASALAEAFDFAYGGADEDVDYRTEEAQMLSDDHFNWWGRGSERAVAGLGRTFRGEFIRPDRTGVVIKFNPWLRAREGGELASFGASGNIHELGLWRYTVDHSDDDLFGTILDYSACGDWLAMRQYVPIYPFHSPNHTGPVEYVSARTLDGDVVGQFNDEALDRGYDVHTKHGNLGLDTTADPERPAVIDYGAHVGLTDDEDGLRAYLPE